LVSHIRRISHHSIEYRGRRDVEEVADRDLDVVSVALEPRTGLGCAVLVQLDAVQGRLYRATEARQPLGRSDEELGITARRLQDLVIGTTDGPVHYVIAQKGWCEESAPCLAQLRAVFVFQRLRSHATHLVALSKVIRVRHAGPGQRSNAGLVGASDTRRYGTPIDPRNFPELLPGAGGEGRRPCHPGARNPANASLLVALDVHLRVAMTILRHSKIAVTMDFYSQVSSASTKEALKLLGNQFGEEVL